MATLATPDLAYDPSDRDTIRNPHPLYRRMRDEAPIYYSEAHDFYAVSRFDDVEHVLVNRDTFISRRGVTLSMLRSGIEIPPGTLIFEDPPTHGIHRALLSRMFTPRRVSTLETEIRRLCADLLDPSVGADGFDFVADLGAIVPMRVIGMLLGIPTEDQETVRDFFAAGRERPEGSDVKMLTGAIFGDYIDFRAQNPSDDIMTQLLHTEFEDETGTLRCLTRDELLAYVNIIAAAGNETTKILIGWTGQLLSDFPDQRRLLVDDPGLIPQAIEEILRLEPNTLHNCRYVAADVELHGRVVPAGSIMVTITPSANRDERRFTDPDRLDVNRGSTAHLSFGFGPHYCLGQALARLEGRVVLDEVLRRFPDWEADTDAAEFSYHDDNRGYLTLPVHTPPPSARRT